MAADRVIVSLPADDVAFLRGFDPDRDRSASRADMVRVIEHLQVMVRVIEHLQVALLDQGAVRQCRACGAPDHPSGCAADLPNILARASGADQPTLRDQLAERLQQLGPTVRTAHEIVDALLPVIEADRDRAKAEAQALVLEGLADAARKAPVVFRPGADVDRLLAEARALRTTAGPC